MKRKRVAEGRELGRDGDYLFAVRACPIGNASDYLGLPVHSPSGSSSSSSSGGCSRLGEGGRLRR